MEDNIAAFLIGEVRGEEQSHAVPSGRKHFASRVVACG